MGSLLEKSANFNSKIKIKINFEGGDLTSDGGLLLYKEFDEKIGFSNTIDRFVRADIVKILGNNEIERQLNLAETKNTPFALNIYGNIRVFIYVFLYSHI